MSTALLLLEIQNDYFPNGRIPLEKSLEAAAKARAVLHAYREMKTTIIHVQHISTHPDAAYFLPCTKGAEFYSDVQPQKGEIIVKKHYANSFKDTALMSHLRRQNIKHLVICGMMTHNTVEATVRAASDAGFGCTVIHDACAARQLEFGNTNISEHNVHSAFLAAMSPNYARIVSADDVTQRSNMRMAEEVA